MTYRPISLAPLGALRAFETAVRLGSFKAAAAALSVTPAVLVAGDLAAGRLVRPFATALPDPYGFWLLSRETTANRARIRAFTGWIRSETGPAPR